MVSDYQDYRQELISRFWAYAQSTFDQQDFDQAAASADRPPVFIKGASLKNVIVDIRAPDELRQQVFGALLRKQQHRWFRSMNSSQALTQSVFGNLKTYGKLDLLADLRGDDGQPLFVPNPGELVTVCLEREGFKHLKEHGPTSVDVFIENAGHKIAVECKLTERVFGSCSRPRLTRKYRHYKRDRCDGRFAAQHRGGKRCSLAEPKTNYWHHIPHLFNWPANVDYEKCPFRFTYQLVRNILAACGAENPSTSLPTNRAVLLYDERNPEFQPGGKGMNVWKQVKSALKHPVLLQKCTWQQVMEELRPNRELDWLVRVLSQKYGF